MIIPASCNRWRANRGFPGRFRNNLGSGIVIWNERYVPFPWANETGCSPPPRSAPDGWVSSRACWSPAGCTAVDPYTYLVDVLQRISEHPARRVGELTPRVWKSLFAYDPLPSALGHHPHEPPPH